MSKTENYYLITGSSSGLGEVLSKQLKKIPRSSIAKKSLMNNGVIIYANSDKKIIEICNRIGPEHLEIFNKNYKSKLEIKREKDGILQKFKKLLY